MRLKSHIWVSAYLRRLDTAFIPAVVVRRGDADAGAIYIKLFQRDGTSQVLAPMSTLALSSERKEQLLVEDGRAWQAVYPKRVSDADADAYLERQAARDPDIWVLEVEALEDKHLLGQGLAVFA
jgi:hypothetical protein